MPTIMKFYRQIHDESSLEDDINALIQDDWVVAPEFLDAPPRQEFVRVPLVPEPMLATVMTELSAAGTVDLEYEEAEPERTFHRELVDKDDIADRLTKLAAEGYSDLGTGNDEEFGKVVLGGCLTKRRFTVEGYRLFRRYVVTAQKLVCSA